MAATFHLRCEVNLQQCAMQLRNATYNPRCRNGSVLRIRLVDPTPLCAEFWPGGEACIKSCKANAEELRVIARRLARMIQKCGHPNAKFSAFRVYNLQAQARLGFPVRLEAVAKKWERHCMYEPEVTNCLQFFLAEPRCSLQIYGTGTVAVKGAAGMPEAQEALRKVYPLLREFSR
mmetsp:Transcript_76450/g.247519  ORF Transcript_76450/g.247519 Transcript_76450/m.247519 type:complete len:176 (-) Transcript_76450:199-726(-)